MAETEYEFTVYCRYDEDFDGATIYTNRDYSDLDLQVNNSLNRRNLIVRMGGLARRLDRYIVKNMLKRKLLWHEEVIHIDGNPLNMLESNLILYDKKAPFIPTQYEGVFAQSSIFVTHTPTNEGSELRYGGRFFTALEASQDYEDYMRRVGNFIITYNARAAMPQPVFTGIRRVEGAGFAANLAGKPLAYIEGLETAEAAFTAFNLLCYTYLTASEREDIVVEGLELLTIGH